MDKQDWQLIKAIYSQAITLAPSDQADFVASQVINRPDLVKKILQMINTSDRTADHEIKRVVSANLDTILSSQTGLSKGDIIDHFTIDSLIGEGGMGSVFLGKRNDTDFEQLVAIKVIHDHKITLENQKRFKRERQILAALNHKNIASLIGGGETDSGQPFMIMEYIQGVPISEYCNNHRLSLHQRLVLFKQVLSAISYAHQNLIIHRDIKPNNVLVTDSGDVKLLDFGIAKLLDDDSSQFDANLTQASMRILTFSNAAPEQILGEAITTATDVYGLGSLLMHMLTDEPVFEANVTTPREIETAIIEQTPIKPSVKAAQSNKPFIKRLAKDISSDLDIMTLKALNKQAERRYASVDQFNDDIHRLLNHYPVLAKAESRWYQITKFVRRNRLSSSFACAFLVCLIAFTSVVVLQSKVISEERDSALQQAQIARQTADYLSELFDAADPAINDGEVFTAKMLLDEGRKNLDDLNAAVAIKVELLVTLTGVYEQIAEYEVASDLIKQAQVLMESDSIATDTYNKLNIMVTQRKGNLANSLGEYEAAIEVFKSQLKQLDDIKNAKNPLLDIPYYYFLAHDGLGDALSNLAREEESLAQAIQAIEYLKNTPYQTEYMTDALMAYGHSLRRTDDFAGSERILLDAISLERQNQKRPTLLLAYGLNQLSSTMLRLSKYEEALPYALEGLQIRQNLLPKGHMETVASMGMVANIYSAQGKFAESLDIRTESLNLIGQTLGQEHPFYAILGCVAGNIHISLGDFNQAVLDLVLASAIADKTFSSDHIHSARCKVFLGHAYLRVNENQRAFDVLTSSVQILQKKAPEDDRRRIAAEALQAIAKERLHLIKDSDAIIQSSIQRYKQTYGEDTFQYQRFITAIKDLKLASLPK